MNGKRSHQPLAPSTIYGILRNETYVGDKLLQKQPPREFITRLPLQDADYESKYLMNDHEPIIERKKWDAVQALLNEREQLKKKGIDTRARNSGLLFGKIICGECGALYTRRTYTRHCRKSTSESPAYKVWVCKERVGGKNGNGCKNQSIREDLLLREIASHLGWEAFDEQQFEGTVDCVVIEKTGISLRLKEE